MSHDEEMRKQRLIFYEDDIEEINKVLEEFINTSQAKCCLVVDKEGHLVTQKGYLKTLDTTSIAALVAGSFASTRQVASMLGETEFSVLFHQGKNENIHVSIVADRALLVIIFDDRTTIGMVRVCAENVSKKLERILEEAKKKQETRKLGISEDFEKSAQEKIEDFFKE